MSENLRQDLSGDMLGYLRSYLPGYLPANMFRYLRSILRWISSCCTSQFKRSSDG
jgi:hypothetical protein